MAPELDDEAIREAMDECSCRQPLLEPDDGLTLCVLCGREPSVRLPAGPLRGSLVAPNATNGNGAGDPRPKRQVTDTNLNGAAGGRKSVRDVWKTSKPQMADYKHIGFVAPPEMLDALREVSAANDRSVSAELRQMVRAHLAKNESATPAKGDALKDTAMTEPVNGQV